MSAKIGPTGCKLLWRKPVRPFFTPQHLNVRTSIATIGSIQELTLTNQKPSLKTRPNYG